MALILSQADIDRIQSIIDRLTLGGGPANGTIDERTVQDLSKIFDQSCGFVCGCPGTFREGLRDNPTATLLKALICEGEGLVVPEEVPVPVDPGTPPVPDPGPDGPDMLSLCSYGLVSGETITNSGPTVVNGDVALHPGSAITGFPPGTVIGTQNIGNAAALAVKNDLITIYDDLQGRTGASELPSQIGGTTLFPGLYSSSDSFLVSSGDLILDGAGNVNSTFIFQMATTLSVVGGRNILLQNGTQAKNVFFVAGTSAVIGTGSVVNGTIVTLTSISLNTGATLMGRALARNGSVTLLTNSIVNPGC